MPDIDPAALSRPSMISTTPILPPKSILSTASVVPKVSKSQQIPARIELEPLYTALKVAIGENWGTYKESISLFVMGKHIAQNLEEFPRFWFLSLISTDCSQAN